MCKKNHYERKNMFNLNTKLTIEFTLFFSLITPSLQSIAEPTITAVSKAGNIVEITLSNSDNFMVGALPYVLKIGDTTLRKSRNPSGGDENILIFSIPSDAFDQLNEDDLVDLGYGEIETITGKSTLAQQKTSAQSHAGSKHRWSLGGFKKQHLLNKNNK